MNCNINTIKVFPFLIAFLFLIPSSLLSQNYDDQVIKKLLNLKICNAKKIDNWSPSLESKINLIKKDVVSIESRELLQDYAKNQPLDCYAKVNITNLLAANLYLNKQYAPALSLYSKLITYRNLPKPFKDVIEGRIKDINSQQAIKVPYPKREDVAEPAEKKDSYEKEIVLLKERINILDDEIEQFMKDYLTLSNRISTTAQQKTLDELDGKIESIKTHLQGKENLYLTLLGLVGAIFIYMIFLHTKLNSLKENISEDEENFSLEDSDTNKKALSIILHEQILDSKVQIAEMLDDFIIAYTDSFINNYKISKEDLPSIRKGLFEELFDQDYENLLLNSDKESEAWKEGIQKGLSDSKDIKNGKSAVCLRDYLIQKS